MRILVTGANGHVGCNLVRELLARGHEVVPMVRPNANVEGLAGLPVKPVPGDVLDKASVEAAADGCQVVINLAANYALRYRAPEEIMRPAVEGVRNVLEVAASKGVGRVVHTSSIVAIGNSDTPVPRTEADWNDAPLTPYYRAKTESERVAWELAKQLGVPLVVLNPAAILGRHDYRLTPSNKYLHDLVNGQSMTGAGGFNYVDARDVALAHALAVERGAPGERYIIGGENLEMRRLGQLLTELTGLKVRHAGGPRWLALAVVGGMSAVQRLFGREPSLTVDDIRDAACRWTWYDSTKAQEALGYEPRPARVFVEDALRWFLHRGTLRPEIAARLSQRLPGTVDWNRRDLDGQRASA